MAILGWGWGWWGELCPAAAPGPASLTPTVCVPPPQFSVFLGLIFFLELATGILAFVFKDWIRDQLNFFINNNVKAYRDDIDLQNLIDFAQEYVSPAPARGHLHEAAAGQMCERASSLCSGTVPLPTPQGKEPEGPLSEAKPASVIPVGPHWV